MTFEKNRYYVTIVAFYVTNETPFFIEDCYKYHQRWLYMDVVKDGCGIQLNITASVEFVITTEWLFYKSKRDVHTTLSAASVSLLTYLIIHGIRNRDISRARRYWPLQRALIKRGRKNGH
ncbi:hypothetical protein AVEN_195396-1 [Araneus ventricosus]|uniref:Uncharacterized protein n=1 Tax=Araneus ventricosus TaxID=182803 RepID=A0A4Y2J1J4_ARAVE|nr:hypothetical protein AVEN_195396-1 [Araneus ventricosus]